MFCWRIFPFLKKAAFIRMAHLIMALQVGQQFHVIINSNIQVQGNSCESVWGCAAEACRIFATSHVNHIILDLPNTEDISPTVCQPLIDANDFTHRVFSEEFIVSTVLWLVAVVFLIATCAIVIWHYKSPKQRLVWAWAILFVVSKLFGVTFLVFDIKELSHSAIPLQGLEMGAKIVLLIAFVGESIIVGFEGRKTLLKDIEPNHSANVARTSLLAEAPEENSD